MLQYSGQSYGSIVSKLIAFEAVVGLLSDIRTPELVSVAMELVIPYH